MLYFQIKEDKLLIWFKLSRWGELTLRLFWHLSDKLRVTRVSYRNFEGGGGGPSDAPHLPGNSAYYRGLQVGCHLQNAK